MSSKSLVIIDGYSLLYRAFFGTRFLSTTDGRPTNALFGFTNMAFNLIESTHPDAVLVALDAPGSTFRHDEFAEYKGTRKEMPEELRSQMIIARELIAALGFAQLEVSGFEADDIVGTVSKRAEENRYHATIITGDLDSLQLVDECITVMTSRQGSSEPVFYTPQAVFERYGFGPEHIVDYKALAGDSSDNIPGVPGIGAKTATKLIQQLGSVEEILARLEEVEEKVRKKIEPHQEQLKKSKWLATIDRNAPIQFDFVPYKIDMAHYERAQAMLESLEFKSHAKRLPRILGPYVDGHVLDRERTVVEVRGEEIEVGSLEEISSYAELKKWIDGRQYALVPERPIVQASMFDELSGMLVAVGNDIRKVDDATGLRLLQEHAGDALLHDGKALYRKLDGFLAPPRFDAMLAGYVLQSGRSSYALGDLASGYLGASPFTKLEQRAVALYLLEQPMRERLEKEGQGRIFDEIELPLMPILAEMENIGICVSGPMLSEFSAVLDATIRETAARIFEIAGQEFSIGSPKQLGEVLFEKMQIPSQKKTKTGYATGAEVLQTLIADHPIASEVLKWRELTKLKSTYADSLFKLVGADGRIHTSFNQTVAATGRLSSNEPNLQNIPIRTELGRQIRKAFVAAEGYRLLSYDYSQIELRLLAHMSKDDALVEAFSQREDVHTVTASLMFSLDGVSVTREQRRLAKMLNYAVLYGVSDFGLAAQLGQEFGFNEARALIKQYFERFPKVKAFTDAVVNEARQKGFTTTLFGRRRYFPEIHAANRTERMYAERQAMNAPIQGSAADMAKIAMIQARRVIDGKASRLLLQVHDELVFEQALGEDELLQPIQDAMEKALPLDVPIEVDAKAGKNWGEMTPVPL